MFNIGDNIGINTAGPSERLDVSGNIRSNSSMIIDNTSATLQLKNAGVNKAFMQLSGNNFRFGTNSGNSTGNIVIRMNGSDLITIDPLGDMDIDGKITTPATGTSSLLPICYGKVANNGSITSSTGNFTVLNFEPGRYRITCNGITTNSVAVVTIESSAWSPGALYFNGYFKVATRLIEKGNLSNIGFSFIVYQ